MIEIAKNLKMLERHSSTYNSGIVICLWPSFLYSVKHVNILLYQNCGDVAHRPLKSREFCTRGPNRDDFVRK